jgi:hypothetical protein
MHAYQKIVHDLDLTNKIWYMEIYPMYHIIPELII